MRYILGSTIVAVLTVTWPTRPSAGEQPKTTITSPTLEDARLATFLDAEFEQDLQQRPQRATVLGSKVGQNRLDDISDTAVLKRLNWRRGSVARLKARFDRSKLSTEAQANYDIWLLELERDEAFYRYRRYRPPFNSSSAPLHSQLPNFLINFHSVDDPSDMRAYSSRLRALPAVLDTAIIKSRLSKRQGVRSPKFQIERVIAESRKLISGVPFNEGPDSPLWADIRAKVGKLRSSGRVTESEADTLLGEARSSLLAIKPGYDRVIAWAEGELPMAPSGRVGAISLPGGAAWYATALKLSTTTDLTADQVHEIGLKEVARIESEQDALARRAGFADRHAYYAERERLFPPLPWDDASRAEMLRKANEAIVRTRKLLPNYFNLLPAHAIEVMREPSFSEVAGGGARAAPPSPDGARPGRVYMHLLGTRGDPARVYSLMCHEGVPGHVMHGDIQVRQTRAPNFRKASIYTAFVEGWGVYSEALCQEMGAYPDIAADFSRLDGELLRAARLVGDTGINAKGWTEEQAVEYMVKSGRRRADPAKVNARRFITEPGETTGYTIGMLKIIELRRKAERELGPRFDIKQFHDLLIGSGSTPLPILERRVDGWITANR